MVLDFHESLERYIDVQLVLHGQKSCLDSSTKIN
jgi:beta-galactosidase beta subunit